MYPDQNNMIPGYFDPRTSQFYQYQLPGSMGSMQAQQNNQSHPVYQPSAQQTQQPASQTPPLKGRIVDDISEVKPNEIPMDGSFCYFPQRDGKKIFVKLWNSNAQLLTFCFIPEEPVLQAQENAEKQGYEKVLERLDEIEAKLIAAPASTGKKKEDK